MYHFHKELISYVYESGLFHNHGLKTFSHGVYVFKWNSDVTIVEVKNLTVLEIKISFHMELLRFLKNYFTWKGSTAHRTQIS